MPIQVNEIVIKAVVEDTDSFRQGSSEAASIDQEAIIAECVEQVLEILAEKKER